MTTITTGNTVGLTDQEHRSQTAAMLPPSSLPLSVRGGVHSGLDLAKTTGMGFTISPGRAIIEPATPSAGPYVVTVTTAETREFEPGDPTRKRIDLIAIKVDETAGNASPGSVVIIKGSYPTSGEPVTPATPPGHEALYTVPIAVNMSAGNGGWTVGTQTDKRRQLAALGGIIPVNSLAERNALDEYEGMCVMRLDAGGSIDRFVKGDWRGNRDFVNCDLRPGWRPTVSGVGVELRARVLADGMLGQVSGELVLPEPYGVPQEGWIMGQLPPYIKPVNGSFILGTSDGYRRAQVFYLRANGEVAVGPFPVGRVMQFHGIFPIETS